MLFKLVGVLAIAAIIYFVVVYFGESSKFETCGKCEGQGFWRGTRGEKEKCDNCNGAGRFPKK